MRSKIAQYLNEIVSLTVLVLMSLALIVGQAGAAQADVQRAESLVEPVVILEPSKDWEPVAILEDRLRLVDGPDLEIDLTFRIRHTGE